MLIDDGVIVIDGEPLAGLGRQAARRRASRRRWPASCRRASTACRRPRSRAMQLASVIGQVFWDEALQRDRAAAGAALDGLTRRELAYGRETSAFEGTREFVFKHHVLHQVAYQGVLKQSRREQHRLTADWLVVRSGDRASEYFGLIAEHYERAGDTVNAADYLRNAGEDATRSYVNAAALDYLGRALALVAADDAADALRAARDAHRRSTATPAGAPSRPRSRRSSSRRAARRRLRCARAPPACARVLALAIGDYPGAVVAAARAVAWAAPPASRTPRCRRGSTGRARSSSRATTRGRAIARRGSARARARVGERQSRSHDARRSSASSRPSAASTASPAATTSRRSPSRARSATARAKAA